MIPLPRNSRRPGRRRIHRMTLAAAAAASLALSVVAFATPGAPAAASRAAAATTTATTGVSTGTASGQAAVRCPWLNRRLTIAVRVHMVLSRLTLADEIRMVEGQGTGQPYVFYMAAQPKFCMPAMGLEDGPVGVGDGLTGVTQLPAAVSLAATFDPSLAQQYGKVIGQEEWGKGAAVNLGPTINIDRDPRWGRSFEAYTEDPFLNGTMAVNEIGGVQSTREMSQVKHFAAYNQETNRNSPQDDVLVSNRTLQEIYFPGFEQSVKVAHAGSVMCSYAMINGSFACNNAYILRSILDQRWRFPGFVTSDYGALHSTQGAVQGTSMEQPFNQYYGTALEKAVLHGKIAKSVVSTACAPGSWPRCSGSTCSTTRPPATPVTRSPPRRTRPWPHRWPRPPRCC